MGPPNDPPNDPLSDPATHPPNDPERNPMSEDAVESLQGEEPGSEHLSYEGNDLPWYVVALWVVSMISLAAYTVTYYLPDLNLWLSK